MAPTVATTQMVSLFCDRDLRTPTSSSKKKTPTRFAVTELQVFPVWFRQYFLLPVLAIMVIPFAFYSHFDLISIARLLQGIFHEFDQFYCGKGITAVYSPAYHFFSFTSGSHTKSIFIQPINIATIRRNCEIKSINRRHQKTCKWI